MPESKIPVKELMKAIFIFLGCLGGIWIPVLFNWYNTLTALYMIIGFVVGSYLTELLVDRIYSRLKNRKKGEESIDGHIR